MSERRLAQRHVSFSSRVLRAARDNKQRDGRWLRVEVSTANRIKLLTRAALPTAVCARDARPGTYAGPFYARPRKKWRARAIKPPDHALPRITRRLRPHRLDSAAKRRAISTQADSKSMLAQRARRAASQRARPSRKKAPRASSDHTCAFARKSAPHLLPPPRKECPDIDYSPSNWRLFERCALLPGAGVAVPPASFPAHSGP